MKSKKSIFRILSMAAAAMAPVFLATSAYAVPLAYVANSTDKSISIISVSGDVVTGNPIALTQDDLQDIKASPDGTRVYVSTGSNQSVIVVDTATNTQIDEIAIGGNAGLLAVSPSGDKIYLIDYTHFELVVINTSDGSTKQVMGVGSFPTDVEFDVGGTKAYIVDGSGNKVQIINTADDSLGSAINVGNGPTGIAVNNTKAYVVNSTDRSLSVIDLINNSVVATVNMLGNNNLGMTVGASLDGSTVYAINSSNDQAYIINTSNNTLENTQIPLGNFPGQITFTSDSQKAYVSDILDNTVKVIDTATDTVTQTIAVGIAPIGVAIADVAICGDGVKEGSEQCDDGNTNSGDGCSSICKNESEPVVCGDGKVEGTEECDDGNGFNDDECSNACTIVEPKGQAGDGCSLSPLASVSALSFLPLAMAPLAVALRRFKKKA